MQTALLILNFIYFNFVASIGTVNGLNVRHMISDDDTDNNDRILQRQGDPRISITDKDVYNVSCVDTIKSRRQVHNT